MNFSPSQKKLIITGNTPLQGTLKAAGAKNAMTKLLVASLLSTKKSIFYNVPNIADVEITVDLCRELGSNIHWDKETKILEITTPELRTTYIPQRFSGANRIPILLIGALLGRTTEEIIVPTVGGDLLGSRPVDFHLSSLRKLGATVEYRDMKKEGAYFAHAHHGLTGQEISLPYPSVGATENTILAAVSAKGKTYIKNAAIEPEIIDLILYLQKMGVQINIDADRTIRIEGSDAGFDEVEHWVLPDRNEIVSYAMAAISTKGRVMIQGARHEHIIPFLNKIKKIGGSYSIKETGIEFFYSKPLKGDIHIQTDVHPGFMTDWQQPFVTLLTQNEGTAVIHETVYENRFGYTKTLNEMNANITLFTQCLGNNPCRFNLQNHQHSLVIQGRTPLRGKEITVPDLRAGFAYVMAALIADDTSTILGVPFLERGYEDLVKKLASLGANIELVEEKAPLDTLLKSLKKDPACKT